MQGKHLIIYYKRSFVIHSFFENTKSTITELYKDCIQDEGL